LARLAILLHEDAPGKEQKLLAQILDFFGVPWKNVGLSEFTDSKEQFGEHALFGSVQTLAAALKQVGEGQASSRCVACFAYASQDRAASEFGLQSLCEDSAVSLRDAPSGVVPVRVSTEPTDITGLMAGLEFRSPLRMEDAVLANTETPEKKFVTIISVAGAPAFVSFHFNTVPVYFSASSYIVDINQQTGPGFYDVKEHFLSAVPLVLAIRHIFREVAWQPQELGACLIFDDPLLRERYGCCDFELLERLMQQYGFTTNIAFIPWNWHRTSRPAGKRFDHHKGRFSISIHGCDHINAEFGDSSPVVLNSRASEAQWRMEKHETRTGIKHDRVMVFPQGIFSSACPGILKSNGYLAAVNTEIAPVDSDFAATTIRDVWDVAIMRYGDFPVFTRRYAHHGLENFAFDLLLGKPCLIVAHHEFFRDQCSALIRLIEQLQTLQIKLSWRSLGDVVRRACRRRASEPGTEEFQMYANELVIQNDSDKAIRAIVRRKEAHAESVAEVTFDQMPVEWTVAENHVVFAEAVGAHNSRRFQVSYRKSAERTQFKRPLSFKLSVTIRRILSEFRDSYVAKRPFPALTPPIRMKARPKPIRNSAR